MSLSKWKKIGKERNFDPDGWKKYCRTKVRPFNPRKATSLQRLLKELQGCSFQGREFSTAIEVWHRMVQDKKCLKVFALAGAMVPAGMGEAICQLLEAGVIDALVTTGANISHDLVNAATANGHFIGTQHANDEKLFEVRVNRIYDTFLPEKNYFLGEVMVENILIELGLVDGKQKGPQLISTSELLALIGKRLKARCMVQVAAERGIPIFCGATTDSEFCLNLARLRFERRTQLVLDDIADVMRFGALVAQPRFKRQGIFIVGGGVPRNWAQQVFPYLDQTSQGNYHGYHYGVRIYTDRPEWGGLSGCTMEESISWGKYIAQAKFANVLCDATIALPILSRALLERVGKKRR